MFVFCTVQTMHSAVDSFADDRRSEVSEIENQVAELVWLIYSYFTLQLHWSSGGMIECTCASNTK